MSPALPAPATAAQQQKMDLRWEQGDDKAAVWQCQPTEISSFTLLATGWQLSSSTASRLWNTNAGEEKQAATALGAQSWSSLGVIPICWAVTLLFSIHITSQIAELNSLVMFQKRVTFRFTRLNVHLFFQLSRHHTWTQTWLSAYSRHSCALPWLT